MSHPEDKFTFDSDVQDDIMRLMCLDGTFADAAMDWVEAGYFSGDERKWLAEFVLEFHEQYSMPPAEGQLKTEVARAFSQGHISPDLMPDLAELVTRVYESPLTGVRQYTVDVVSKFARDRSWRQAILAAAPYLNAGDYDKVDEIMTAASQKVFSLETGGTWYFEGAKERISRMGTDDERLEVFPTGIREIDLLALRHGGIRRKELAMVGAATGGGKSIMLAQIARRAIYAGYKVAFYSFEMAEDKIAERFDSGFTGVNMWDLREEKERLMKTMEELSVKFKDAMYVKEFPTKMASVNDIRRNLDQLERRFGWVPDLVIFDYATIIKPPRFRDARHLELQEVMEEIRGLLVERNLAGWTAVQLNKEGKKKHTSDSTGVAGSWDQNATLDYIFILNQDDDEKKDNVIRIFIDKVRDGRDGFEVGPLLTDWEKMCFIKPSDLTINEMWDLYFNKSHDDDDDKTPAKGSRGGSGMTADPSAVAATVSMDFVKKP